MIELWWVALTLDVNLTQRHPTSPSQGLAKEIDWIWQEGWILHLSESESGKGDYLDTSLKIEIESGEGFILHLAEIESGEGD